MAVSHNATPGRSFNPHKIQTHIRLYIQSQIFSAYLNIPPGMSLCGDVPPDL